MRSTIDARLSQVDGKECTFRLDFQLANASPRYTYMIWMINKWDQIVVKHDGECRSRSRQIFEYAGTPGMSYKFVVKVFHAGSEIYWCGSIARNNEYQLGKRKMKLLKAKAEAFCRNNSYGMRQIRSFSRAMTPQDWYESRGLMETSIRTNAQGNPSPLNYSHGGIYFFARPSPIYTSYFGSELREFPTNRIFPGGDPNDFAFYFADFKCYGNPSYYNYENAHYILIAVCRRGSEEHRYCQKRLGGLQLNLFNNPFLSWTKVWCGNGYRWEFYVPAYKKVWIEIFFMENIEFNFRDQGISVRPVEHRERQSDFDRDSNVCQECYIHY